MIDNSLKTYCCGTYPSGCSKSIISLDTNINCLSVIDMTGKFIIYNAPINISEHRELIIVSIDISSEPSNHLSAIFDALNCKSDTDNHFLCKVDILIKSIMGLDFIMASPYQWFVISNNSCESADTLLFIFRKEDITFPVF
ncbi:MAG: hypothetical protein ACYDEX_20935 [Mobilitalea sp.]